MAGDVSPVTLTVVTAPGEAVVALEGDLDIASVPAVRERLLSLLRPGACRLVIDMSAVRYADASGLEVLVSTRRRAVLLGGTLRLAALQPEVAGVLIVAGLSRHLGTYPSVRAAVADRRPGIRTALPGTGPAVTAAGDLLGIQGARTHCGRWRSEIAPRSAFMLVRGVWLGWEESGLTTTKCPGQTGFWSVMRSFKGAVRSTAG